MWLLGIMDTNVDSVLYTVERERKKAEKQAKFDQKNQKKAAAAPAASSKSKEKKAKAEKKAEEDVLPQYVEDTPAGEKKSLFHASRLTTFRGLIVVKS
jgi:hypothetical protein